MADTTLQNETILTNWQKAWEAFASAKGAADEYERAVFKPAEAKILAARSAIPLSIEARQNMEAEAVPDWDAINDKMEELNGAAYSDRAWELALTPAPDRDALEWKMDHLFGDCDEYSDSVRMDAVNAFLADVRRMLDH